MTQTVEAATQLRDAVAEDAPVLLRLMHGAFEEYRGRLDPPSGVHGETVTTVLEKLTGGTALLATVDGKPAGCVFMRPEGKHVYFSRLSVLPGYRHRGVGRALIACVERRARDEGYASVWLGVRLGLPALLALYERLGYKTIRRVTHSGYSEPTYVLMEKTVWSMGDGR